ncbi:unnamed protein product [Kuraishia capsulata CBS 1993]|uniref:Porphobilinogen deaminase n=1 Tax=Kuraishia capsulata CBS 1993 TaxID=1382522 RepID=W6MWM5_9ASCO|nr:uncharacterized protein KUCA_T00003639001 [Kuraishia capsulata CBS 1993]CDK27660.1 unnamed protein product [Kuraishia capsulata CBS 1993]
MISASLSIHTQATSHTAEKMSFDFETGPLTDLRSNKGIPTGLVKLGSRKSLLAIKQSEIVEAQIKDVYPHLRTQIVGLTTFGDEVQNKPLYSFGGKSLWTKELEVLLYEKIGDNEMIDLIVHSLKDMPTHLPEEFELGCILKREGEFFCAIFATNSAFLDVNSLDWDCSVGFYDELKNFRR